MPISTAAECSQHLVGTLALLSASEQARVTGFAINRFRGDENLLTSGIHWLQQRTGKRVFGVLPYLLRLVLDAEDAISREPAAATDGALRIVVPALPRISNHTDFDPLRVHPQINLQYVGPGDRPPPADVVILPGSKSVRADLTSLRTAGWDDYLQHHLRYGGKLIGICGGFQMMGRRISDPDGLEGPPGETLGLGCLDFDTVLQPQKQLRNVSGKLTIEAARASGYEIHAGLSEGPALRYPAVTLDDGRTDRRPESRSDHRHLPSRDV